MGITISDLRRAILGAGDVSAFTEVCHQALGRPPILSISSIDTPVALLQPTALLEHVDKELATIIATSGKGSDY